jgi:hypothetical protein
MDRFERIAYWAAIRFKTSAAAAKPQAAVTITVEP